MSEDTFFNKYITHPQDIFHAEHKSRVLVVDDDPVIRDMVVEILKQGGFAVDSVEDGFKALAYISKHPPTAMILDLQMPGMTGVEVLTKIRTDLGLKGMRVVVFSAFITPETEGQLHELEVDAVLPKPFDVDDVLASVRKIFAESVNEQLLSELHCVRCGSTALRRSASCLRSWFRYLTDSRKRYCKKCGFKWST